MTAILNFLEQTGFYQFAQDGNWKCLIMMGISFVLMYLAIVKKFEPLLLLLSLIHISRYTYYFKI